MKTLAICGDSWFSTDPKYPEQSFSELLSKRNNWNLISLARGGCSNFTIALQINKAIELGADFILCTATTHDRIELPIPPFIFDPDRGLANIKYQPHPDLSSQHEFLVEPTVISESINNLTRPNLYNIPTEQASALMQYVTYLYDDQVKRQMDSWIISDACRRLVKSGIPFLIYTEALYFGSLAKDIGWISNKNRIDFNDFSIYNLGTTEDTRFHYKLKDSPVIADYIQQRINTFNI
jgi:hypothetical protein